MNAGYAQMTLGVYARAETTLRAALAAAERLGLATVASPIRQNLGLVLALRGSLHEARATETSALDMALEQGDAHVAALSHAYLAQILVMARNYWAAEREARAALELIEGDPSASSYALAMLASALLGTGKRVEALDTALEAVATVEKLDTAAEEDAHARLVHAEARWENGDVDNARLSIARAASRLRARARRIGDRSLRRSFLENVPVNARTLALAHAWRGGESSRT
jgi:tetratricopeptide (TPR) repeat protein